MRKTKLLLAMAALVAALAVTTSVAGGAQSNVRASTATVSVKDDFFTPKSKSVSTGSSVKWNFRGTSVHNVTFTKVPRGASKRGSGDRTKGDRPFTRSFTKSGTYKYECTIHDGMTGSVKAG